MRNLIFFFVAFALMGCQSLTSLNATAIPEHKTAATVKVLVLGSYHFGNPGQDINNVESTDVRTPERQAELEALISALATFEPTVIVIESQGTPPSYIDGGYAAFRNAPHDVLAENPNETVQIGYRLAHQMALEHVFAVDEQPSGEEPDYFPYDAVSDFAQAQNKADELKSISDASALVKEFEANQTTHSIPELLMMWNDGNTTLEAFYWDVITLGEGEAQPGAELAAYWFMRNAKIFNKIVQVSEPGDRVVVVFGAGHAYWLREIASKMTGYSLEPVMPYLEQANTALAAD